jgi:small subunit ribosomal protein S1
VSYNQITSTELVTEIASHIHIGSVAGIRQSKAIEESLEVRQAPADDHGWWTAPDESYWHVLLEQGEIAGGAVPPVEPQEIFDSLGIEPRLDNLDTESSPGEESADQQDKWQIAGTALERGDLFSLRACGANRGGLLVKWNGLQGFVPASHLNEMSRRLGHHGRVSELTSRIGESLTLRLIEVDPQQSQLVFSERAATQHPTSSATILHTLQPGDVCQGVVTNLTTFGAFVDLGGVEGLLHISEISWERVRHPGDVLRAGQDLEVQVIGVNPDEGRIALSLKRLRPDPWTQVDSRYRPGQLVEGTVTNVVSFGAFVRLEEGLEGLIHISELAEGSFMHPRNVVREGDVIQARVLNIDTANHRMGLSLRQVHGAEPPPSD